MPWCIVYCRFQPEGVSRPTTTGRSRVEAPTEGGLVQEGRTPYTADSGYGKRVCY